MTKPQQVGQHHGLIGPGFLKWPGWQTWNVTFAGYPRLHSSQDIFNSSTDSTMAIGMMDNINFYKSIANSLSETAPETLLECRMNCHLHYLWNSNLNSTASIKQHFFSCGREYCLLCPSGPPFQITNGFSIVFEPHPCARSPHLAPCPYWSGQENENKTLKRKKNIFLEPLPQSAVKSDISVLTPPGPPAWLEVFRSSVNDTGTAPASNYKWLP